MGYAEPFLFRYKKECISPSRATVAADVKYDESIDMLTVLENGVYIPAIASNDKQALGTKKADIEKGEDQKDTLMWNA